MNEDEDIDDVEDDIDDDIFEQDFGNKASVKSTRSTPSTPSTSNMSHLGYLANRDDIKEWGGRRGLSATIPAKTLFNVINSCSTGSYHTKTRKFINHFKDEALSIFCAGRGELTKVIEVEIKNGQCGLCTRSRTISWAMQIYSIDSNGNSILSEEHLLGNDCKEKLCSFRDGILSLGAIGFGKGGVDALQYAINSYKNNLKLIPETYKTTNRRYNRRKRSTKKPREDSSSTKVDTIIIDDDEYNDLQQAIDLSIRYHKEQPQPQPQPQQPQPSNASTVKILLQEGLFEQKSGKLIDARILGYIPEAEAYAVEDVSDGHTLIVQRGAISAAFIDKECLSSQPIQNAFKFHVGDKLVKTFDSSSTDMNGNSLAGVKTIVEVLYFINNQSGNWYVVYLPLHDDINDQDRWWSAFDIVKESTLQPLQSLKTYKSSF